MPGPDGQPTGAANPNGGDNADDQPKYITEEQVSQIVNAAVTSQLKRELPKHIQTAITGVTDTVKKTIADELAKAKPQGDPGDGAGGGDKGNKRPDPEMVALQEKIKQLENTAREAADRAAQAEKKQRDDKAYAELRTCLEKHVKPEFVDVIAKSLFFVDKKVTVDDDGNVTFTTRRSPGGGLPEEDMPMPLADGVAWFVKQKDAEPFLPPPKPGTPKPGLGNAGGRQPSTQLPRYDKPATTDAERIARAAERERALNEQLKQNEEF